MRYNEQSIAFHDIFNVYRVVFGVCLHTNMDSTVTQQPVKGKRVDVLNVGL